MIKTTVAFICLFLIVLFPSCQNHSAWYPAASVTINAREEFTDPTMAKGLALTLVVHNTGSASIVRSTVTVQVKTAAGETVREYLQTVTSDMRIIPGGKIAITVSFAYIDPAETLLQDGVAVYDSFFE
jgi:hypothetical protein